MSTLADLFPGATARPWHWEWPDESVIALYGPKREYDHVLWAGVCKACAKRHARCTAPSDVDAKLIVHAVNTYDARDALLRRASDLLDLNLNVFTRRKDEVRALILDIEAALAKGQATP